MTYAQEVLQPHLATLDHDAAWILGPKMLDLDFTDPEDIIVVLAQLKRAQEFCQRALMRVRCIQNPGEYLMYLTCLLAISRAKGSL